MGNYLRLLHEVRSPETQRAEEIADSWATHEESIRKSNLDNSPPDCLTGYEITSHKARIDALETVSRTMINGCLLIPIDTEQVHRISVISARNVGIDFERPQHVLDFDGTVFHDSRLIPNLKREIRDFITANQGDL